MTAQSITSLDLDKTYSYADYLKWNFRERIELLLGKVFRMSPAPGTTHQKVSIRLSTIIFNWFEEHNCEVFAAPFDVRLPKRNDETDQQTFTVVQPDLCIICDLEKLDERGCKGAPDLVVEILSPGNTSKEMDLKFKIYEEAGVKEYWMLEPNDKAAFVYVLNEEGKYIGLPPITVDHTIQSPTFPGLNVALKKIFPPKSK